MSQGTAGSTDDAGILATWRESSMAARALLVGVFVHSLGGFIQIFLVLFLTDRGFSAVQAGLGLGLYGAGAVVGVLIGGAVTDRIGPRLTILISLGGSAPLFVAVLYLQHYPSLLVTVTVVGLVSQAFSPASRALLSTLTPAHQQIMIFAMYRLSLNIGTTAAPLIGAALLAVSYDLLFWSEAMVAIAYALIAAIALPRRGREPGPTAPAATSARRSGYLAVLADRRYVLFLVALLINATVYMQYMSTLPVAMREAGLATMWYAAMLAVNGVIVISCELLVTKVVQRWPMRIVMLVGFVMLGAGLAVYALPFGLAVFVVGTLIWSVAEIVAGPTIFAYPAKVSPERLRGRYLGSASAMFGVGAAIGPVAGLALWGLVGNGVWLWYGVACLLGAAVAWYAMRPTPPTTGATDPEPVDETDPADSDQPLPHPERTTTG